jgi:hypothetical protein
MLSWCSSYISCKLFGSSGVWWFVIFLSLFFIFFFRFLVLLEALSSETKMAMLYVTFNLAVLHIWNILPVYIRHKGRWVQQTFWWWEEKSHIQLVTAAQSICPYFVGLLMEKNTDQYCLILRCLPLVIVMRQFIRHQGNSTSLVSAIWKSSYHTLFQNTYILNFELLYHTLLFIMLSVTETIQFCMMGVTLLNWKLFLGAVHRVLKVLLNWYLCTEYSDKYEICEPLN